MDKATFNKQYDRAVKAGILAQASEPRAVAVRYDEANNRLIVELRNGVVFIVPCSLIQGLNGAQPKKIAAVIVMPRGAALHWDELDVQMSVPGLVAGVFGTRRWMAELRRKGRRISQAKQTAVRENGRKGRRERTRRASQDLALFQ